MDLRHRYKIDEKRKDRPVPKTNVLVRAWSEAQQKCVNGDLAELDKQSLLIWLSDDPERAVRTVLVMLGHQLSG